MRLALSNSSVIGTWPASKPGAGLGKVRVCHRHLLGGAPSVAYARKAGDSSSLLASDASWRGEILFREGY